MSPSCSRCGQEGRPGARFCAQCGAPLEIALVPGAELKNGDYCIVRSLTKGGMGAVFLAEDRRAFDRYCVIKQMLDYYDPADPGERLRAEQRFQEEGRTLASLSHPGTPRIYAFFEEHGRFYIVMEYIQGENLETFVTHEDDAGQTVPGRRLPQEEVIRYVIQAARILEYLHAQPRPVVHQDIKPANLILESQLGQVRLVDFGTARAKIPQGARPGNGRHSSVWGTDGYAPPEQYRGKPVPQSDVFALAATAYHLLTDDDPREHPFKWPKLGALPRELAVVLERALRTAPERRSSARELREALEALSTPKRTLESFTFPGGTQIRSVSALPTLCDEHWEAARSFLYHGDFQRWLRDLNRHDLVVAADAIVGQQPNRDEGLEAFLRQVDSGLPQPLVVVDTPTIDLGSIARESALVRRVTAVNSTRGYVHGQVSSSQPWLEIHPESLDLWAGKPTEIRVNVRAESLPFRSQQRGIVQVRADGQDPLEITVTARVSLLREAWRLLTRATSASIPESWRTLKRAWLWTAQAAATVSQPFCRHPWLLAALWLALAAGLTAGLYFAPDGFYGIPAVAEYLQRPGVWADYIWPALIGPPLLLSLLWLAIWVAVTLGSATWGALRGAFRSFFR